MSSRTTPTVFVVDDDEASRLELCRSLRSFDWAVAGLTSEHICRSLSPASTADCLLLDVNGPTSTALRVLAAMHLRGLTIPVVAITAQLDAELVMRARARNVRAVLHQPINSETLQATILQVIAGRTAMTAPSTPTA